MPDKFPYRCIVYDLDGTLIDSRADIAAALNAGRAHFDLPAFSLDEVLPMIGHGLNNLVENGFRGETVSVKTALPIVEKAYRERPCEHSVPYSGVIETLAYFQKDNIAQYIVSNKPSCLIPIVLKTLNLASYFKQAFGADDFPRRKPDPMAIFSILELEKNLDPSQVLMVGDMSPDIEIAQRAGIDSAFCSYGYSPTVIATTYCLQQFSDLTQISRLC